MMSRLWLACVAALIWAYTAIQQLRLVPMPGTITHGATTAAAAFCPVASDAGLLMPPGKQLTQMSLDPCWPGP